MRSGFGVLKSITHSYAGINRIRFKGFVKIEKTSQADYSATPRMMGILTQGIDG